jgi:hypothetical protein
MKALFPFLMALALFFQPQPIIAQVNSGSNGSDGAFNPTSDVTIDMPSRPDGIYQYSSVNIPSGVNVTFTPNAKNTPVVWLVQGACIVSGVIDVSGQTATAGGPGAGGPGGWSGGIGGTSATPGQGPGGGDVGYTAQSSAAYYGGSYGGLGSTVPPGSPKLYGNVFLLPLLGGSGGGGAQGSGSISGYPAGGGGGALLIVASDQIQITGSIRSNGGAGYQAGYSGAAGSGGAIRLICSTVTGSGSVSAGGGGGNYWGGGGGSGRIRFDVYQNNFTGSKSGIFTQGFQPIILPVANQGIQLGIASIGGVAVAGSLGGVLANPDVIIPALQSNPINVVVNCTNVPLNTDIIIKVHPASGADVTATAKNTVGTNAASTASIPVSMPRGGGIVYASAVTGIAGSASSMSAKDVPAKNIAQTGWTANGEKFVAMEITAGIGGKQRISYITDTGKRYAAPVN